MRRCDFHLGNSRRVRTVVIDAGHGGIDAGGFGHQHQDERKRNKPVYRKVSEGIFCGRRFNAVLTRSTQGGLYGTSTKGFKMRDMKNANRLSRKIKADMVISIHQNFCPIPSRRGGTVFFDKYSQSGKTLAESIQQNLNEMKECVKQNSPLAGDFYMLKCTQNPSVLVECGFLSNGEDEALLISAEYQKALAYAIFKGAVAFYS